MKKILNTIKTSLTGNGCFPLTINLDSELVNNLGCDELDYIELVLHLEERFGIEIQDREMYGWKTVKDIIETVRKKLNEKDNT